MRRLLPLFLVVLSGCDRLAWDTTVAETAPARLGIMGSVLIGQTTETEFVTRWGNPTQKVYEGGQVEYVYRQILDPGTERIMQFGTSERWVIVTFRYGTAVAVRSSDTETCRATFPPRPPGHGFSTPTIVMPVGDCAPAPNGGVTGGPVAPGTGARPGVPRDVYDGAAAKLD